MHTQMRARTRCAVATLLALPLVAAAQTTFYGAAQAEARAI